MGGRSSGHDPFDIFSSFFGGNPFGGGGSSRGRRQRRGEDIIHPMKVSLEDLYNGTTKRLCLSRNVICSKCKGKGSKSGASMKCSGCQGSGIKISIRQLGPMIQQMQHSCNQCKGIGETISARDHCPQCKGEKVVQEKKVLKAVVQKGMQNGQKITFPGEADQAVHDDPLSAPVDGPTQSPLCNWEDNGRSCILLEDGSQSFETCGIRYRIEMSL
ncbi:DNAj domain protein [Dionaea muscipula]